MTSEIAHLSRLLAWENCGSAHGSRVCEHTSQAHLARRQGAPEGPACQLNHQCMVAHHSRQGRTGRQLSRDGLHQLPIAGEDCVSAYTVRWNVSMPHWGLHVSLREHLG